MIMVFLLFLRVIVTKMVLFMVDLDMFLDYIVAPLMMNMKLCSIGMTLLE